MVPEETAMIASGFRKLSVIGLVVVIVCGCAKKDEPSKLSSSTQGPVGGAPSNSQPEKSKPTPPLAKADFVLTAHDYDTDWKKDAKAAEKKYEGKMIELKGELNSIGLNDEGIAWVSLRTGNKIANTEVEGTVSCQLLEKNPWAKLGRGQTVTLRGRLNSGWGFALVESTLLELGPNPAIILSASDLAKEYGADKGKTLEKYEKKSLIVDGEIASKDEKSRSITLKADGKLQILCGGGFTNSKPAEIFGPLKVGQRVKILGQLDKLACDLLKDADGAFNGPGLHGCFVITAESK
jgi:tRNA_anti-like